MKLLKGGHKSIWKRTVREKLQWLSIDVDISRCVAGVYSGPCQCLPKYKDDKMESKFVTFSDELKVGVTATH